MPLIDGVGDEVVQFVCVVLLVVVAALAWWSTNARPDRYRTVLVMRSRHHPVTLSITTRQGPNLMLTSPNNTASQPPTSDSSGSIMAEPNEESTRESTRVIPLQEMDSIVDADMAMLNHNRLHFYRRMDSPSNTQSASESTSDEGEAHEDAESAGSAQIREMDSIVSAMEAEVTTGCDFFARPNEHNSSTSDTKSTKKEDNKTEATSASSNVNSSEETAIEAGGDQASSNDAATNSENAESRILIKLKYLNDTLKEVEGSLDELLKDFKWRHFSTELSSQRLVRLIFNGRVLGDEAATLRACGLHHRAVVHCLVHPAPARRPQRQHQPGSTHDANVPAAHEVLTDRPPPERAWDLENILMTLVSVALTVVWFFRCEYSNMFTASASVALFGLTVFYSVAIFGLYLSDTFHFDRRPPQPVPNN